MVCQPVSRSAVVVGALGWALAGCGVSKQSKTDDAPGGMGGSAAGMGSNAAGSGGSTAGMGGSAAGAAGRATGGMAGAPPEVDNPFPCENPTPVGDEATGFVACSNGYVYREQVGRC